MFNNWSWECHLANVLQERETILEQVRSVLHQLQGDFAGFPIFCEAQIFDFQVNIFYR